MIPRKLLDEIERWIAEKKFGHLQINFSDGRIVNVNRVESIKIIALGNSTTTFSTTTTNGSDTVHLT